VIIADYGILISDFNSAIINPYPE